MGSLPYTDTKPQGAADFYFVINATFSFMLRHLGEAGFIDWLTELGVGYYAPVNTQWREGGLPAVARYWRDFFAAEPGSEVEVTEEGGQVLIAVKRCPAILHLKAHQRDIVPCYCRHCAVLGQVRADSAGLSMQVEGGNGSCIHRYAAAGVLKQDIRAVREVR
jgi:hypothetical protein